MKKGDLEEIKRRLDHNQGVHISRWSIEMWRTTMADMRALIREVEACWTEIPYLEKCIETMEEAR